MNDVTRILTQIQGGNAQAAEELLPLVYEELRRLASIRMAREMSGHTLQPTALVHEAYLRLVGPDTDAPAWNSRGHFFAAAAEAMRRILIENARRKASQKRGGGFQRIDLNDVDLAITANDDQLLAVNEALEKLEKHDQEAAALIKLRFFGGMTHEEASRALGVPERTASRLWAYGRAWLFKEIQSAS